MQFVILSRPNLFNSFLATKKNIFLENPDRQVRFNFPSTVFGGFVQQTKYLYPSQDSQLVAYRLGTREVRVQIPARARIFK